MFALDYPLFADKGMFTYNNNNRHTTYRPLDYKHHNKNIKKRRTKNKIAKISRKSNRT